VVITAIKKVVAP